MPGTLGIALGTAVASSLRLATALALAKTTNRALRPLTYQYYASQESLYVVRSFEARALSNVRQKAIEIVAYEHAMDLATTKSLQYDPALSEVEGKNHDRNIRIGPLAFAQDQGFLAQVIFHEIVHSDQYYFYSRHAVTSTTSINNPKNAQIKRLLLALDEFECWFWSLRNAHALGLNAEQTKELKRELRLWQVEIDEPQTAARAKQGDFDKARLFLIAQVRH